MTQVNEEPVVRRLRAVEHRIASATAQAGREAGSVRLIAVTKTAPLAAIAPLVAAGHRDLGENRAQELAAKAREVPQASWAMLGPIQTNKAREVAQCASEVHALDRASVAEALDRRLRAAERSLDVLIQVNTSAEASKSGVAPHEVAALARAAAGCERLQVRGLMTIATRGGDEHEARRCFALLRRTAADLAAEGIERITTAELSMGMSGDLEWAIAEGATVVRVGRAILGERPAP